MPNRFDPGFELLTTEAQNWRPKTVSVKREQRLCFRFLGMVMAVILAGSAQSPEVGWGAPQGTPVLSLVRK